MQIRFLGLSALSVAALGAFAFAHACGGDDETPPAPTPDGGTAGTSGTAGGAGTGGTTGNTGTGGTGGTSGTTGTGGSGEPTDGGTDAATPVFLTHFSTSQLPEGIWARGDAGAPLVGMTALSTLVTVSDDGGVQPFGTIVEAGAATASNLLGIVTDPSGNVYAGVGTLTPDAGPIPAPGIYKFPAAGGAGTLFSSAPAMRFPNGLTFMGTTLFVADSAGVVYSINAAGTATAWSNDPLLAPNAAACNGMLPAPIGANGIVHDATAFYVTNTNYGRIVKIPMDADGGAGTATKLVEDCALAGSDGLTLDTKDGSLVVAVNIQNKIVRVSPTGQISVITSGGPLDFPASVVIDSVGAGRRLLFTNAALFSGDAGRPGVLTLPIP